MPHSLMSTSLYIQHNYLPCSGFWAPCDANVVTWDDSMTKEIECNVVSLLQKYAGWIGGYLSKKKGKKKMAKETQEIGPVPIIDLTSFLPFF